VRIAWPRVIICVEAIAHVFHLIPLAGETNYDFGELVAILVIKCKRVLPPRCPTLLLRVEHVAREDFIAIEVAPELTLLLLIPVVDCFP
jgi:hypothetical protein